MNDWTKIMSGRRAVIFPITLIAAVAGYACCVFLSKDELPTPPRTRSVIRSQVSKAPLRTSPVLSEENPMMSAEKTYTGEPKRFIDITLTPQQVEGFLSKHHRNGLSLIAAFSITDDPRYLEEAIEKAPELPEVALVALAQGDGSADEDWIRRLQAADPDNSLVQFLSSYAALSKQDGAKAFDALKRTQILPEFDDYSGERMRLIEEAYLDAGYSQDKASALASKIENPTDSLLTHYLEYADLVSSHMANYRSTPEKVDWILQSALKLGTELMREREGKSLFIQAGGALYQQALYEGVLESAPFPSLAKPPGTLAAEALGYKEELVALQNDFVNAIWLQNQSDEAVVGFFQQKRAQGEYAAVLNALEKLPSE